MIIYDNHFNTNEWLIVAGLCFELIILILLPKRFPRKISIAFFMCGVFTGFFFDHSLSVEPVNFYDVNDNSSFEVMDFLSYWTYGLVSYLFFYIYDWLRNISIPFYILLWSVASTGIELFSSYTGIFHYRDGYSPNYSFVIYLLVQSLWIAFYYRFYGSNTTSTRREKMV